MLNEAKAKTMFDGVEDWVKECPIEALDWAIAKLEHEQGTGHQIQIHTNGHGQFQMSFAKASWGGDHVGRPYHDFQ